MSIKVICDGCADESGALEDSMWRTLDIDLSYLRDAREYGSCDSITQFVLCPRCVDELRTVDLTEAIAAVFAR